MERNERESTDGCVFIKTKVDLLSKQDNQD